MKNNYDFTDAVKNPYINQLKKQVTIRLDIETIDYFKEQARQSGIPYQNLINAYLADCARNGYKPKLAWS